MKKVRCCHQNSDFTSSKRLFHAVISVVLHDENAFLMKNSLENFSSERRFV